MAIISKPPAFKGEGSFIFASYSHKDEAEVYPIIEKLQLENICVWYDEGIPISEHWAEIIPPKILGCSKFIVFISENAFLSDSVKREIDFAIDNKKPIIAIHLAKVEFSSKYRFLLQNIQALMKYETETDVFFNKIAEAINKSEYDIEGRKNIVPPFDYNRLIDRVDVSKRIHDELNSTHELVILKGTAGIGKTSIVSAYCNNPAYSSLYDYIVYVAVIDDIKQSLMNAIDGADIGFKFQEEEKKEDNFDNCIKVLGKIRGNKLLIIDNADDPNEILKCKEQIQSLKWRVLITSRSGPEHCRVIDVAELELQYCKQLFCKYYTKPDKDSKFLEDLIRLVNYHTLLIKLIAQAAAKNPILNIQKLYEIILQQDGLKQPLLQNKITINNPRASQQEKYAEYKLYDYIMAIFDLGKLDENEKKYLRFFSVLPSIEISFADLIEFFQVEGDEAQVNLVNVLSSLSEKGWLIFNESVELEEYRASYKCHQIVQVVIREKLNPNVDNVAELVDFFSKKLSVKSDENWAEKKSYIPFAIAITENIKGYDILYIEFLRHLAAILNRFSQSIKALGIASLALKKFDELENGGDETVKVKIITQIGLCEQSIGKYEDALKHKIDGLRLYKKQPLTTELQLAKMYRGIGNSLRTLNKLKWSIQFHLKAIELLTDKDDRECMIALASSYDNIGMSLTKMEKFQESLDYRYLAYNIRTEILPERHSQLTASLNNIGFLLSKMERHQEALEYQLKSLEIRKEIHGDRSSSIVYSYNNLATVYRSIGDYDLAIFYSKKAIDVLEEIFISEHPRLANGYYTYALTLFNIKKFDEAKVFCEKALKIREKILKANDPVLVKTQLLKKSIEFINVEIKFWDFQKRIKQIDDITPINLQSEKEKFLDLFVQNKPYNPQFVYKETNHYLEIDELNMYLDLFSSSSFLLSDHYKQIIIKQLEWINQFHLRVDGFSDWLVSVYGRPEKRFIDEALAYLSSAPGVSAKTGGNEISAAMAAELMQLKLSELGYKNWKVEITNMTARVSVNALLRTVKIKNDAIFSEKEMQKIIVHEIHTHVLRNENGRQQCWDLFSFGFPDYLYTEEGLAIMAETLNGFRIPRDDLRYALRLVICDMCVEHGFYDLFAFANGFMQNPSNAFDLVARIKRGMTDTSLKGGYTKDQVYFAGYQMIKDLSPDVIRKLYVGKIGIGDLELLEKLGNVKFNITLPEWIEDSKSIN